MACSHGWLACPQPQLFLYVAVWQSLAAVITQVAADVVTHHRQLHDVLQQRQPLLPHSLREMHRMRQQQQEGSSCAQERWHQLQELTAAARQAQQQLQQALAAYRQCCALMEVSGTVNDLPVDGQVPAGMAVHSACLKLVRQHLLEVHTQGQVVRHDVQVHHSLLAPPPLLLRMSPTTVLWSVCVLVQARLWWRDAHLLPQPAATVLVALQEGVASPAALLALATVNAFLHPLWQQRVVADWR